MPTRQASRLLKAIAVAAFLSAPIAAPLFAQNNDERVELIMGGLPPKGSPAYNALIKFAGDAKGQVLPLTKCEMWSVRRSRLSALQKAAGLKNVSVKVLDNNWNQVFQPMSKPGDMAPDKMAMMEKAKQSQSTMSVGVMAAPAASMVEYALTKGMDDKTGKHAPMSIKIALNDKMTVNAIRQDVTIEGNRCTWRGIVEGTDYPVTIMWWGSGRITGTIHYGDRLYQLKYIGGDVIGVVETMVDKLPDEHARASPKRMQDMRMREDTLFKQGDSSSARPKRGETQNQEDAAGNATRMAALNLKAAKPKPDKSGKASTAKSKGPASVIDVMVVHTAKAASHYSDITRDLIELGIEETNQSFRASKINNVAVRLVHVHQTDYVETGAEHFDHVWRMVDRGDGYLEEVSKLRDEKKADIVILVVDDPSGCGLATRVAADADEAYAVVHHECAASSYSIAHEIGHIIGTRHDRSLDNTAAPFPNGHGYVSPDLKWRTMMSYKAGCNGCPRLPIWSTPEKVHKGQAAGDLTTNNAAVIREQSERVARFR